MAKAYSNKALPSGTILREWRLEEVLGVGGFGIVYKGRGIYFDELVAIKEYFPSAISERDEESTVVPIDSNAEEVHALGLKKFVEEAKLLWNLSTPSRHPNIVSVRSLFEIHGTAYMVMDFEEGVSLTEVLKRGEKFDEAKLREMVLPVASGLERAHRVGVLHRDIKPSNILITDSGQPVLIDFGSARFETEGVTSTTVTFHTPPYAAIEQYVKTYEQGPWTDIYALGVVLYRCITGEKPAEVLERLHGEKEPLLVEGNWPGYSREFLAAVDTAMIIKPSERPRSLPEWLAMFDGASKHTAGPEDDDEEATRIMPMASSIEEMPRGSPARADKTKSSGSSQAGGAGISSVPDNIDAVKFKMAGDAEAAEGLLDHAKDHKAQGSSDAGASGKAAAPIKDKAKGGKGGDGREANDQPANAPPPKKAGQEKAKVAGPGGGKTLSRPMLLAGGAAVLVLGALVWSFAGGGGDGASEGNTAAVIEEISHTDGFGPALLKLAGLAREKNIDPQLVSAIEAHAERISSLETENAALGDDEARKQDISFNRLRIADFTRDSLTELASGLSARLTSETRRLAAAAPWADPRRSDPAAGQSPALKAHAAAVEEGLGKARASVERLQKAETAELALPLAQGAILAVAEYKASVRKALQANPRKPGTSSEAARDTSKETAANTPEDTAPAPAAQAETGQSVDQIRSELGRVAGATDDLANQVIRMARIREPGRDASDEEKQAFRTLESNARAARDYKSYLDRLKSSMRGAKSTAEAEKLLVQGLQTRQYVSNMIQSSRASRDILER